MDNRQKHAYLIMAHDNFEQLSLLIRALDNPRVDIYIHIDANSDYKEFVLFQKAAQSGIELYPAKKRTSKTKKRLPKEQK